MTTVVATGEGLAPAEVAAELGALRRRLERASGQERACAEAADRAQREAGRREACMQTLREPVVRALMGQAWFPAGTARREASEAGAAAHRELVRVDATRAEQLALATRATKAREAWAGEVARLRATLAGFRASLGLDGGS